MEESQPQAAWLGQWDLLFLKAEQMKNPPEINE